MQTSRRQFIKQTGVALIPFLFPSCSTKSKPEKTNIIFIMADDLGYGDSGCYGQKLLQTPNIDQLAKDGIRFTQAYAGAPVCTPSRSVLMTGLHGGHTPARDNVPHYHTYLEKDDVTIAEVLKKAGYRCGGIGKWSLGDAGTVGSAMNKGFDTWLGYLNQDHAHYYYTEYLDDDNGRMELAGNTESRKYYSHDLMTERALEFISDSQDQPFFLYAAYTLPHYSAPEEDKDGLTVPSIEYFKDKEWDDKSKKYATMVHMLDRDVGKIVKLIDELGLGENTLIIFTSDNGGHDTVWKAFDTNGPLRGYKRNLSEGGIRVPFVARWTSRVPAGVISNEIIVFQDMMPTFAEIANVDAPADIDGISVLDALLGKELTQMHDYLYWDYGHCRDQYDQAVRMGDWKGIREGQGNPLQLYNLLNDVGEEKNIAAEHPEIVKKIENIMDNAVIPSKKYPVGKKYTGGPIWKKNK